jgi:hypothetical protein
VSVTCSACDVGMHGHCVGQGCDCPCQLDTEYLPDEAECPHGIVRSLCEQCEQEEQ